MKRYTQLTREQRYQISMLRSMQHSQRAIARYLGVHPSTISRELARNRSHRGFYEAWFAHHKNTQRRKTAEKYKKLDATTCSLIEDGLRFELSPEQIAGRLNRECGIRISHETIYGYVYRNKMQGGNLYQHLRKRHKSRQKRKNIYNNRGAIRHRISIDERPLIVDARTRLGDWEMDTLVGKGRQHTLLSLTERRSLFTIVCLLKDRTAAAVYQAVIKALTKHRQHLKTITVDNGSEFAHHEKITAALKVPIYFAHPYSAWERGANENANGLIRQYLPKSSDFSTVTQAQLDEIMFRLNNRPRKTRDYQTPNEVLYNRQDRLVIF